MSTKLYESIVRLNMSMQIKAETMHQEHIFFITKICINTRYIENKNPTKEKTTIIPKSTFGKVLGAKRNSK